MRNRRIAIFVPTLFFGGVERVMVNLAEGFCNRGFDVDVVAPQVAGELHAEILGKVRIVNLDSGRVLTSLSKLVRYMQRERPAAVIAAMEHSSVVAIWARTIARVPLAVIATVHTNLSEVVAHAPSMKVRLVPIVSRTFLHKADAIVAVSHGVAENLSQHAPRCRQRTKVIFNPIITPDILAKAQEPVEHPWFQPGQSPVVLGTGRLAVQKDFATLIRSFALLRRKRRARLVILGEGPERHNLEALIAELGISPDVCLLGYEENPHKYMSKAALFVLSSAWEGFGNVLVEALAAGVPVVATDCRDGPREILKTAGRGRLVTVGDAEGMANQMLASLDEVAEPVPPEALKVFTLDHVVEQYAALLPC